MGNPLVELQRLGQSPWHDNIHRALLTSGALKRMVAAGDVTGLTSNPTIFEQAIARSTDYDDMLARLARRGMSAQAIVDALAVADIRDAADVFAPVFKRTAGGDGMVSIEVAPEYAHDTETTVKEAHRLWKAVNRPNLMVKIPATPAGVPAIEQCIADGLNINVTLIFSLQRYREVMDAYLGGLARRVGKGKRIDGVNSVASFFVSRVDTAVDKQLEDRLRVAGPDQAAQLRPLIGQAAIANAKLAYAEFRRTFDSDRFRELERRGGRKQRPLWASTSTKNPAYPDVYYVEALVGPDTVDTLPPATITAYKDHGKPVSRLDQGLDEAVAVLQRLEDAGIRMDDVTRQLEVDGVASFAKSFDSLVAVATARREAVLLADTTAARLGASARAVRTALGALDAARTGERLWKKDPTLWKPEDGAAQDLIAQRLDWLDIDALMTAKVGELTALADEVRHAGFTRAVLCGMGGSSLAPEVFRRTFGVARGHLDLVVLDSTDPAAVLAAMGDPARTLYVISSKSGDTTEVTAFLRFFSERVRAARGERSGEHFIAITDAGTSLEAHARQHGFRRVFLNPPGIGGRFSALSYFGLVPAALLGIDLEKLLARSARMRCASGAVVAAAQNPSLFLGAVLGALAKRGRDKLTIIASDRLASLGGWIEQLVAESTGKEGKGIVPVTGEVLGPPRVYGQDRLFVYVRLGAKHDRAVTALARAGHPVVTLRLKDIYDLGAEMLRWEIAVAVACRLMEVNPFDQPNVQESKENTGRLLADYAARGTLADATDAVAVDASDFAARLRSHLGSVRARDYVAVVAYVAGTPRRDQLLRELQTALRDRLRVATTVGYGPRFQHSTGQLHKGGAANGVIVQLTCSDATDAPVPGEPYSFSVLKTAQALGDYQALASRGRRVMRIALGLDVDASLRALIAAVRARKKPSVRAGKRTRARRVHATRGRRRARRAAAR